MRTRIRYDGTDLYDGDITDTKLTIQCANSIMLHDLEVLIGEPTPRWAKYDYAYVWTIQPVEGAQGRISTFFTRRGKMVAQDDIINHLTGVSVVDGQVRGKTAPKVGYTSDADMPTSASGYAGYYVGADANGIWVGTEHYTDANEYVAVVTNFSSLAFMYTFTYNLMRYATDNVPVRANDTILGYVEDEDQNAYPENGYQDGYWYVRIR